MITENQYKESAKRIGCSVAAIKAVASVESNGSGFQSDKTPTILFEPHIFWKQLKIKGIDPQKLVDKDPSLKDILYPVWGTQPYGKSSIQNSKLERASKINREAALMSASYGLFQIMGFNWKMCGAKSLQDFINAMYQSEDRHLDMFDDYIISAGLDDELKNLDWKGFARGYNGPLYTKNAYDKKLQNAYNKFI